MEKICFGRKAVLDNVFIVLSLFMLMLIIVLGYILFSNINTKLQANDSVTPIAKTAMATSISKFSAFDTLFLFVWLGLFITAVISAWYIDTHPAFFILSVLLLIIILVLMIPLVNLIESTMASDQLVTTTVQFPIIYFFVQNLFKIIVIQAFVILIALYAKSRSTSI